MYLYLPVQEFWADARWFVLHGVFLMCVVRAINFVVTVGKAFFYNFEYTCPEDLGYCRRPCSCGWAHQLIDV